MTRVLIVDDKEENLYYLQALLGASGYTVECAHHGAEALVKARLEAPDVVISDLLMPVMDGYTLLRHWKADTRLQTIPFVVYTATYTEAEDEQLALNLGADAFILKPAEPHDFIARLHEVEAGGVATPGIERHSFADDHSLLKNYSETLIRKLEEKTLQLEETNRALQRDVIAREASEAALHKSKGELRALAESIPQLVWMADAEGEITYCNRRWVEYTGLEAAELRGQAWSRALHPDDRSPMHRSWLAAVSGKREYSIEARMRGVDGGYRWMLVRAVPLCDEGGLVSRWMGTCTDIDNLKRSTEALRISEERFRLLARSTNDALWDWDVTTDQLWWSEGFETLSGYRRDEVEPTITSWSQRIHPDDQARVLAGIHQAIDGTADTWSDSYRFRRRDGSHAHVVDRGYMIRAANGHALRMVGGMTDVSERQRLEEQLRQSQRLESIGQLTGGVAHDFNNLLTVIIGNAELLHEQLAGDRHAAGLAGMVLDAGQRGAELTRRLLAFARRQALEPRVVDLNRLMTDMDLLLRRTLGEQLRFESIHAVDLWPALVDPAQLESALLNLCINARDAMPHGGRLTVETCNVQLEQDCVDQQVAVAAGHYVLVSVSDTGIGIAHDQLQRVFEPFYTTKPMGKGTGLGLAMVYGFVKQSGGSVSIRSEPGAGTTVKLYLPRAVDADADATHVPAAESAPAGGSETILMVEDDAAVAQYTRGQLISLGYTVLSTRDAAEALELLRGDDVIDLLFTDVVMPGMGGRELALEATRLRPAIKVLYTSGYTDEAIVHHGQLDQGVHLLGKPYRRADLARRIRETLAS